MIKYAQGEKIKSIQLCENIILARKYKKITRHYKWKGRYVILQCDVNEEVNE